jgi:transcriptional regulator with XRE-family HTH domain
VVRCDILPTIPTGALVGWRGSRPGHGKMAHMSGADSADVGAADEAGTDGVADPWTAQMNALGAYIRAQRQLARLSLREMANLTNISNAYLSQVERGLHQPSLKVLHSIADALHLSAEQLLDHAGWAMDAGARTVAAAGVTEPIDADGAQAGSARRGGNRELPDTEAAITADPRLSDSQRRALIGVYRSFVGDPGGAA